MSTSDGPRAPSTPRSSPPPSSTSSSTTLDSSMMPKSSGIAAGRLRVEVLGARNLHAAVLGSLLKWTPSYSNPFVVVTLHREAFATTIKDKTLNPTWKETGGLDIPLPTEQELLQTVGFSATGADLSGTKLGGGGGGGSSKALGAKDAGSRGFQACHPELLVQVYHRPESQDHTPEAWAVPATRQSDDQLIGEVTVPVLPCLMSSSSSHRAWYSLASPDHPDAGQIHVAMNYDVGGMEPIKGDIVRLVGFGGMEYYAKLLNANARLEVIGTFQDQVVAQCRSIEGWMLSFEFHRNLIFVVRRPSILGDAQSHLQGHIVRVRRSPLVTRVHGLWESLPEGQREQLRQFYHLAVFSGHVVYEVVTKSVQTTLHDGVHAGIQTCVHGSGDAVNQVTAEFARVYWGPRPHDELHVRLSRAEELMRYLEGGPLKGRGRIVQAFSEGHHYPALGMDMPERTPLLLANGEEEEKSVDIDEITTFQVMDDGENEGTDDEDRDAQEQEQDEETEDAESLRQACPDQLICPITGCPMVDPVVAADGHSYEREAILHWFAASNISPMTGMQMPTTQVFPNFTLRKLSEEFQQARYSRSRR